MNAGPTVLACAAAAASASALIAYAVGRRVERGIQESSVVFKFNYNMHSAKI